MIPPTFDIRPVRTGEWDAAVELLRASGLPVADLAPGRQVLWGAWGAEGLLGVIGAEGYGDSTLVRSLAVGGGWRGKGIASALYRFLEDQLGAGGPKTLVLLTETAEAFFARRGFAAVPRDDLPGSVRQSAEFQELCPVSAVAMAKSLS